MSSNPTIGKIEQLTTEPERCALKPKQPVALDLPTEREVLSQIRMSSPKFDWQEWAKQYFASLPPNGTETMSDEEILRRNALDADLAEVLDDYARTSVIWSGGAGLGRDRAIRRIKALFGAAE